jgi:hypothetical protein
MAKNYKVEYSTTANAGSWVTLSNVQDISFSIGRQFMLDQYSASTGSLTIRYPTGYATPNTAMVPDTYVRIWGPNTTDGNYAMYHGIIKDVSVTYGIPYAGGVGNADYLNVTLEGGFAQASRMSGQNYAMAAGNFYTQCNTASTQTGLSIGISATTPQMAASTVSGTWGDWINASLVTINGRMSDCTGYNFINLSGPYNARTCTVNFSDVANNATNQVYDQADFGALSDNFYTQITVDPADYAAQTATNVGATVPYRTYTVNTLSASTGQALDQANFLLSQYGTQKFALTSVSCLAEAQSSFQMDYMGLTTFGYVIGARVSVTFRGTTYYSIIEGVRVTATPQSSRYTFYLSGADLNNYLVLNDTVFGRLDYNKLGY